MLLIMLSAMVAHGQVIIKGKVTDAENGNTIPGASVYLNGTYIGTATDANGAFALKTTKTNIPLVVSFIGYQTEQITNYTDTVLLNISLKHKVDQLKEVKVTYDGMSREDKMKLFLTEFMGDIGKDYVIINPNTIWLQYKKSNDELSGGAEEPLTIKNKKLGYKITYYLDGFKHAGYQTIYRGNYVFAEDTAGLKPKAIQKILDARDEVYYGSRMHFIRSLWANKLADNGFQVFKPNMGDNKSLTYTVGPKTQLGYDSLVKLKTDKIYHQQKFIVFDNEIYVRYRKAKNDIVDSYVLRAEISTGTVIDADGFYGSGIQWRGNMGFPRVSNLLPYEFTPTTIKIYARGY